MLLHTRRQKKIAGCAGNIASGSGVGKQSPVERLEADSSGELEVAACIVAGRATHGSEAAAVNADADAAERDFIGYVLTIRGENELKPIGDVERAADTAIQVVGTWVTQAIERMHPGRIAKHEVLHVAEWSRAARAIGVIRAGVLGRTADKAIEVGNRAECCSRDPLAPTPILTDRLPGKAGVDIRHTGSGQRLIGAGASRGGEQQRSAGDISECTRQIPSFDDLAKHTIR